MIYSYVVARFVQSYDANSSACFVLFLFSPQRGTTRHLFLRITYMWPTTKKQGVEWKLHFLWDNPTRHIVGRDGVAWSSLFHTTFVRWSQTMIRVPTMQTRSMRKRGFGSILDAGCCKFVGGENAFWRRFTCCRSISSNRWNCMFEMTLASQLLDARGGRCW